MTMPLVSIIIPCFNNDRFVRESVESALNQSYEAVEVIVVDDGSTDDSASVLKNFGSRITLITQSNSGACVARNRGLSVASGQWIKFLDADDVLMVDCLSRQLPSVIPGSVLFGDCELIDEAGRVTPHASHLEASNLKAGDRASLGTFLNSPVLTSTTLYPREVLSRLGGFDPNVMRGQEHELHLRLYLNGVDFHYSPQICYQYRQHFSPHRISTNRRKESHYNNIENFRRLIQLSREGARRRDFDKNKRLLAQTSWRIGRRMLRNGDGVRAKDFFSEALELSGSEAVYGTSVYKLFAKVLGPNVAEWVSFASNKLRRKSVERDR